MIPYPLNYTKRGKLSPPVTYYPISCEPDLCPVTTLNHYITHTKTWREGLEGGHQLLLSTLMPHKPVCKSTIARWVKEVLKLSGIDIMCFQAHSTRSAATSKAKVGCLKIEAILKKGNWSRKLTWQNHYHKPIVTPSEIFQIFQQVLSSLPNPL